MNEVFLTKYVHRLHIYWEGNDNLIIECENCAAGEVKKKLERFGTVQIMYR